MALDGFSKSGAAVVVVLGLAAAVFGAGLGAALFVRGSAAKADPPAAIEQRLQAIEQRLGSIDRRLTRVSTQLEERTHTPVHAVEAEQ